MPGDGAGGEPLGDPHPWPSSPTSRRRLIRSESAIFVPKSPFSRTDSFIGGDVTTRHVCAYLYPKFIHAGDTTGPIARADKRYTVTRK